MAQTPPQHVLIGLLFKYLSKWDKTLKEIKDDIRDIKEGISEESDPLDDITEMMGEFANTGEFNLDDMLGMLPHFLNGLNGGSGEQEQAPPPATRPIRNQVPKGSGAINWDEVDIPQ